MSRACSGLALCFASAIFVSIGSAESPPAAKPPHLPDADRTRLAEAIRLAEKLGNKVWPDWDKAPFAILLVADEREFLINHSKPSADFTLLGDDAVLKQKVWTRKRTYSPNLLATFPAVGGVSTIVIGQAANTESKTSTRWVITLLHEHFHQLQSAQPRYYAEVDALRLARGDQTGMWMLNYPFPYANAEVKQQFSRMAKALGEVLPAREERDFAEKFASYLGERKTFRSLVKDDDWKYFTFQIWQEGIARYTELRLAELAASGYEPSQEFQALKDFKAYKEVARAIREGIEKDLASLQMDKAKRTVVYNFGAAEALVLDRARPDWRKRYFADKFTLDGHFRAER